MKPRFILIVFILINNILYSQNLKWEPVPIDVGLKINTIHQDSLGRLIVLSEKGLYIVKDLEVTEKIDEYLPDSIEISCVAVNTQNQIFAGTMEDGVFQYKEDEKKWNSLNYDLENLNVRNMAVNNKDELVVGTLHASIFSLENKSWRIINLSGGGEFRVLKFNKYGDLFCAVDRSIFRKYFNSKQWDRVLDWLSAIEGSAVTDFCFYNNSCLASTNNNSMFFSQDSFKTIISLHEVIGSKVNVQGCFTSESGEFFACTKFKGIYYSNNNGTSFEQNNQGLPALNVRTGLVLKDERVAINVEGYGLYLSEPPKNIPIMPGGWLPKQNYAERKAHESGIDFIKYSNDGKKIFTISGLELKIWEAETGYHLETHSYKSHFKYNLVVSDDDSTVIIADRFFDKLEIDTSILLTVYRICNDSVLGSVSSVNGFKKNSSCRQNVLELSSDFIYSTKELFTSCRFYEECLGPNTVIKSYGSILKFEFGNPNPKKTVFNEMQVKDIAFGDNNISVFLYNPYSAYFDFYNSGKYHKTESSFLFLSDPQFNIIDTLSHSFTNDNNTTGTTINSFRLNKNGRILAGLSDSSKIILWNINIKSKIDSMQLPFEPFDYKISKNEKYLLTVFNSIVLFSPLNDLKDLDSIEFNVYEGNNCKMALSPDSRNAVVGSTDGFLRLFQFDDAVDVEDEYSSNSNNLIAVPNPSYDYIKLLGIENGNLILNLYNSKGMLIDRIRTSSIIDISRYEPGFYFITVGNKICYFIKI